MSEFDFKTKKLISETIEETKTPAHLYQRGQMTPTTLTWYERQQEWEDAKGNKKTEIDQGRIGYQHREDFGMHPDIDFGCQVELFWGNADQTKGHNVIEVWFGCHAEVFVTEDPLSLLELMGKIMPLVESSIRMRDMQERDDHYSHDHEHCKFCKYCQMSKERQAEYP